MAWSTDPVDFKLLTSLPPLDGKCLEDEDHVYSFIPVIPAAGHSDLHMVGTQSVVK